MPLHGRVCTLTSLLGVQHAAPLQGHSVRTLPFSTPQCRRSFTSRSLLSASQKRRHAGRHHCRATSDGAGLSGMDANQLQTALQIAVDSEDFQTAGSIRDELRARQNGNGSGAGGGTSWRQLGVPDWLADRAEQYGLRFPTEVQTRAAEVLQSRRDAVIQSETGSGKTLSFLMPVLSQLDYPPQSPLSEFEGPQCVVLVPTRELGVQIALLVYRLFGGNPTAVVGIPGQPGNMFRYSGPRGLQVRGVLDDDEAQAARGDRGLRKAHVVVATPPALAAALQGGRPPFDIAAARFLVVDEVDACFQRHSEAMETLLSAAAGGKPKPALVFVGATVQDDTAATAVAMGWMEQPETVAVGQGGIPRALRHACIECEAGRTIAVLCRQIRADLNAQGDDGPPARVIVFAASEQQAAAIAEPLRNVLWGEHSIAVLLPGGQEPIQAMHAFRDNKASLLIATPAAARGLDLPAVSFVYNTSAPSDATDYLHRAGRAGRIGSSVPGTVVTLLPPEQRPQLQAIAQGLHIDISAQPEPAAAPIEAVEGTDEQRQRLDELYHLSISAEQTDDGSD